MECRASEPAGRGESGPTTALMARNWTTTTHSRFEHERRCLDFIRRRLVDREPLLAWSNFEFVADSGAGYRVSFPPKFRRH